MTYIELLLIGVSLCFDTFAVSLTGGVCMKRRPSVGQTTKIFLTFALFQAGFTFLGWILGTELYSYIEKIDHWIAFLLLGYIGVNMIMEGLKPKRNGCCDECARSKSDLLNAGNLVLLAVATSIDALAEIGRAAAAESISAYCLVKPEFDS